MVTAEIVAGAVVAAIAVAVAFDSAEFAVAATYRSDLAFAELRLLYSDASAAIVGVVDPALAFVAVVGRPSMPLV